MRPQAHGRAHTRTRARYRLRLGYASATPRLRRNYRQLLLYGNKKCIHVEKSCKKVWRFRRKFVPLPARLSNQPGKIMVTQKAISFKIDEDLLERLDKSLNGLVRRYPRNRAINAAIRQYLEAREAREDDKSYLHDDNQPSKKVISFMRRYLCYNAKFYLDLIDYH